MEKLNREEVLCLIRKMGGVAIRLRNTSIHAVVTNQKYVNILTELSIDDLKYVAGNYIRSVAKLFDYEGVIEYDFAFDSIIIAAKATILKNSYIESATLDETDKLIDDRWIEDNGCDDDYPYDDDEEQTQCSSENTTEDDLVDSLNNDLDDCLSKNWFLVEHFYYILEVITAHGNLLWNTLPFLIENQINKQIK